LLANKHVPDELVIRFAPGIADKGMVGALRALGAEMRREIPALDIHLLGVPSERLEQVLIALRHNPNIDFAEPNYLASTMDEIPSDPRFPEQWGLVAIGAPAAWSISTGSADVTIAIVDTGVDLTHPDLDDKIVSGWDFVNDDADSQDDNGHGTHVAGIAAANRTTGLAWQGLLGRADHAREC
jgi:thermitase